MDKRESKRAALHRYRARHPDRVKASARATYAKYRERNLAALRAAYDPDKQRRDRLRTKYGLNYDPRVNACCEACGTQVDLCVDHNHETGVYRGVLCRSCNLAFGGLNESPLRMLMLAQYAQRHATAP